MPTLRQAVKRLRDRWLLPTSGPVSARDLNQRFQPVPSGSLQSLLLKMNEIADVAKPVGGSTHPYYRRPKPTPQNIADFSGGHTHIDLTNAHMEPYGVPDPVTEATRLYDKRAAAAVYAAVGPQRGVRIFPNVKWKPLDFGMGESVPDWPFHVDDDTGLVNANPGTGLFSHIDLLEMKFYGDAAPTIYIPRAKCLAALAYHDYFPDSSLNGLDLPAMVSEAIMASQPGWCGTFGPDVTPLDLLGKFINGDYDMSQMHLLQIAYRYYDKLSPEAQEHLITRLLARGTIHRVGLDDIFTSGGPPNDWSRAGIIDEIGLHKRVAETENHILTIHTARYLTNQLLYQRDHAPNHDNRRNGSKDAHTCTELVLMLLRNILRDDFSEYNAKNYQNETRSALLNLVNYAYDHEVRLAAQMVLDYISAHIAVSSNDLRRMVPFRRRNEGKNVTQFDGYMGVGLLEMTFGADPMAQHFAILTGNTRAYEKKWAERPNDWSIKTDGSDGHEAIIDALSDYRLPPSIHDLFVNDSHRRFFQRLHRTPQDDVEVTGRNCDNHEIYAGSPSYLITAGGAPATYAIDPRVTVLDIVPPDQTQQLGVAVTTSFMPTTRPNWIYGEPARAQDLIQFSHFSDIGRSNFSGQVKPFSVTGVPKVPRSVANYGVAPDFACGHRLHLPGWVVGATLRQAINRLRELTLLPTTDTVSVRDLNQRFQPFPPGSVRAMHYKMREIMVKHRHRDGPFLFVNRGGAGAGPGFYLAIYDNGQAAFLEAFDTWRDPNVTFEEFKRRVIATNPTINIQNNVAFQYTTQNGNRLDCIIWNGPSPPPQWLIEKGVGRPLTIEERREIEGQMLVSLIREHRGATVGAEIRRIEYGDGKPMDTLVDAGHDIGPFLRGTVLNSRKGEGEEEAIVEITNHSLDTKIRLDMSDPKRPKRTSETGEVEEAGNNHEVWVNFGWKGPSEGDFFRPFNTITAAAAAVADGGVIKIVPGWTTEKPFFQSNKRIRLVAPIGNVTFGVR